MSHRWDPPTDLNVDNVVSMVVDVFTMMTAWVEYRVIYDLPWKLDYWGDRYVLVRLDRD